MNTAVPPCPEKVSGTSPRDTSDAGAPPASLKKRYVPPSSSELMSSAFSAGLYDMLRITGGLVAFGSFGMTCTHPRAPTHLQYVHSNRSYSIVESAEWS